MPIRPPALDDRGFADLVAEMVHVTRGGATSQLRTGDSLAPLAFPDLVLEVAAILP